MAGKLAILRAAGQVVEMTAIEIPAHVALPRQYTYWHMTAASLDEARAVFARRFPHYDTTVYHCGNRFWFVMDYERSVE